MRELYILDEEIYLNKKELKEKMPDYTLIRSDLDEKFLSNMNTKNPKRSGF